MKRYLIIKIGGSEMMGQLITKALDQFVFFGEGDMGAKSSNLGTYLGTMLMFNFMSDASIDEITFALKDIAITNFIVTEITDDNFRAHLIDSVNKGMDLNKFKHTTEKTLDDMSEAELNIEMEYAIEHQLFERCGEIKVRLTKFQKK